MYMDIRTWISSSGIPLVRYSTARSGLLKEALKACSTSVRSNPIEVSEFTASSYDDPDETVDSPGAVVLKSNKHIHLFSDFTNYVSTMKLTLQPVSQLNLQEQV